MGPHTSHQDACQRGPSHVADVFSDAARSYAALTDPCISRLCAPAHVYTHERTHRFGLLFTMSRVRFGGHVSGKGPAKDQ